MKIGFAGTPEFAKEILEHLVGKNYNIVCVITGEDKKVGRGKKLTANPVKTFADKHNLTTYQPYSLNTRIAQAYITNLNLDVLIVVAYAQILTREILCNPKYGCLNIHTSLLPKFRGAAPMQRAIEAGDTITGVSIMQMNEGLDTGDVLYTLQCSITDTDTTLTLHNKLIEISKQAISYTLGNITTLNPTAQKGVASYAHKLTKTQGKINWRDTAQNIYNQIRAFNPYPIAYTTINDDKTLRIIEAELMNETITHIIQDKTRLIIPASKGSISLKVVQLAGKKAVKIQDFNNSVKVITIQ